MWMRCLSYKLKLFACKQGVTNRSSIVGNLIDKLIKSILLDNNRLISLKNRTKSIITKYWGMCIDFIDFNHDIIHGQPKDTKKNLEKLRESKRKQLLKARSKELSTNWKGCSLFTFLPCNYLSPAVTAKLWARFRWFSVSSVLISVFLVLKRWEDMQISCGRVLKLLVLQRFGKRSPVKKLINWWILMYNLPLFTGP